MTTSVKATWLQEKESQVFNFSVIVSGLPCVCVCVCVWHGLCVMIKFVSEDHCQMINTPESLVIWVQCAGTEEWHRA